MSNKNIRQVVVAGLLLLCTFTLADARALSGHRPFLMTTNWHKNPAYSFQEIATFSADFELKDWDKRGRGRLRLTNIADLELSAAGFRLLLEGHPFKEEQFTTGKFGMSITCEVQADFREPMERLTGKPPFYPDLSNTRKLVKVWAFVMRIWEKPFERKGEVWKMVKIRGTDKFVPVHIVILSNW